MPAGTSSSCSSLPRQVGSFAGEGDRDNQVNVCGSFFSFESALYSLSMEMLLLIPLDMKNMRRWIHQSLGEVERERKELIDVYDYLRVLPGFYMDKRKNMNPLNFLKKFLNERKWKERWGKGWLGSDGRLLPVFPRERLLHTFFFAEGIEGGPDYECKMMEKEDKLMRRFMRLEALIKQRGKSLREGRRGGGDTDRYKEFSFIVAYCPVHAVVFSPTGFSFFPHLYLQVDVYLPSLYAQFDTV